MSDDRSTRDGKPETPEIPLHVALFREADDLRALHRMIGTKVGDEPWTYWDTLGIPLTSAVENLLSLCGFAGELPPTPEVQALSEDDVSVVILLGFTVPASKFSRVREGIAAIASGQLGGFLSMVVAQSGFHDSAMDIFAHLRSHCGNPPIWISRPSFGARGGGRSAPLPIPSFVADDSSFIASNLTRGIKVNGAGG